jgi:ribosomal protein L37AE/L43A
MENLNIRGLDSDRRQALKLKLAKEIVDIYPKMFTFCVRIDCEPDPYETYAHGMGVGLGWYGIIKDIVEIIKEEDDRLNLENNTNHVTKVSDIKEKWGGLRFYCAGGASKKAWDAIEKGERDSYHTCEECGSKEDVGEYDDGWISVKCKPCAVDHHAFYIDKGYYKPEVQLSDVFETWAEKKEHEENEEDEDQFQD